MFSKLFRWIFPRKKKPAAPGATTNPRARPYHGGSHPSSSVRTSDDNWHHDPLRNAAHPMSPYNPANTYVDTDSSRCGDVPSTREWGGGSTDYDCPSSPSDH